VRVCPAVLVYRIDVGSIVIDVKKPPFGATGVQLFVRDNDVEQALRILKRKMQHEERFQGNAPPALL